MGIIWTYHEVHDNTCDGYVNPYRQGNARNFPVPVETLGKCAGVGNEHQRNNDDGAENVSEQHSEVNGFYCAFTSMRGVLHGEMISDIRK
mgnify:CR=1 FL=1